MENRQFKYDAFISYRHCELDKYVAENLHRILECYELPKNIKKKLGIKGKPFKRVFRDQEELPLSSNLEDPIIEALKDSKYLIVICSPRLKDSLWCKKEIQTFKKLRGRKNIFCILIEGEPSESFPEEVLFDEEEVTLKNGKTKKEKILVEPLAADVRGETHKEVLKKIKEEKLRLVAPMYNLDYDDLKQRHKQRRNKQILMTVSGIAIFSILFAIYSLVMFIKIQSQQNILAEHQALSLAEKAINYLKIDDRYDAIKSSYNAISEFNDVNMPYTPEAEYALTESLGVYDAGTTYKAISEIQTKGVADYIKASAKNKYIAVYDESEEIGLYESKTLNKIASFEVNSLDERAFSFIGDSYLSYINKKGNISIVNTKDGKQVNEIEKEKDSFIAVQGETTGTYLTYVSPNKLYILNINDDKVVGTIDSKERFFEELYYSDDSKYVFALTGNKSYDINKQESSTVHVISTENAKETHSESFNAGYVSGIFTKGDNAYMLLNNSVGAKYNALVVSYNYINGNVNWTKTGDNAWGKFIIKSFAPDTNSIAVVRHDQVIVLNAKDGSEIESFNCSSEVIDIYSFTNKEIYLVFLKDGSVNYINMEYKNSVEYKGKYEFNLEEYSKVVQGEDGFLLIPRNENRVILYALKKNDSIKEENIELDLVKNESISSTDADKIKEKYNLKNKNLVEKIIYDKDKKLMFVNYTNNDIAIYDVKTKELLNKINKVGKIEHYFGKDKYNRIYVGDISDAYILDSKYNLVGHIKSLAKLEKDKVIIKNNDKYYSIKIYNLDEMKDMALKYLGKDFDEIDE